MSTGNCGSERDATPLRKGTHPFVSTMVMRSRRLRERVRPLCCALLGAALVAGCATTRGYEGPPLPASERAIVRADPAVSAGLPVALRLRQVDGRDISLGSSAVELPPGAHELLVDCRVSESGSVRRFVVAVELAAGADYRLVATATARNCEAVELIRH